jgi:SAM-dependent methyltransferase
MAEPARSASGMAPGRDPNVVYALGSCPGGSARLQHQADELSADSAALLDRVGSRGILDLLAERVTPAGRVAGLDVDLAHTAMAAEFAARRGLSGVEIITADARSTGLATGSFDLVHARTLLINLPEPADVAAEMMRLARPGGRVTSRNPTSSTRGATRAIRPSTGSARSSRWPSAATAPARGSSAGCRSCSARQGWTRPGRGQGADVPSALTWCAAYGRTCWRWV